MPVILCSTLCSTHSLQIQVEGTPSIQYMYAAVSCLELKGSSECDVQLSEAAHLAGHNGLHKESKHCKHGQPTQYPHQSVLTFGA